MRNPGDVEEYQSTAKNLLISPSRKILLDKFTSSTIKRYTTIFHQISVFISLPYTSLICSCNHCCCIIIFLIQALYVCTCHANFDLFDVYWMLSLALQKHWKVKFLLSIISIIPSFSGYLENSASRNACFSLFHSPIFISNLIKFQLTSLQLILYGLCTNQIQWIPN